MRSRLNAILVGALTLAAASGVASAQGRKKKKGDQGSNNATLVLWRGAPVEDVELNPAGVKFAGIQYKDAQGKKLTLEGEKVKEVVWESPPAAFSSGLSQLRAGLFDRAVDSFTAARNEKGWVAAFSSFYLAEAQRQRGSEEALAAAIAEYDRLLKNEADHWLVPACHHGKGLCFTALKRVDEALAAFQKLEASFGEMWRLKGKVGEGFARLEKGDTDGARTAFALAERGGDASIERAVQVGIGQALVMDKRYDDAVKNFERIVSVPGTDPEVAGSSYVGIGDCRWEQAKAASGKKQAEAYKLALIAYETCAMRYALTSGYAKALYQAARCYEALGKAAQARIKEEELKSRCPSSPYTRRLN